MGLFRKSWVTPGLLLPYNRAVSIYEILERSCLIAQSEVDVR